MTVREIHALLEAHRDARGIEHWNRRQGGSGLRSIGIGRTRLRKLAKQIGRDHALARQLWTDDFYEARVVSLLIDDPRRITRAQAEAQVEALGAGQLPHVFSSCDAQLARVPVVQELARHWMLSTDPVRQGCGYGLLYELSKARGKAALPEADYARWVAHIGTRYLNAGPDLRLAMATALMGIGKRSASLNRQALAVAKAMGPVDRDPTRACEPFDVVRHIDDPRLRVLLGVETAHVHAPRRRD